MLVTSGERYGAVLNRDFDSVRYLDALAADGLNHTRTFSEVYREVEWIDTRTGEVTKGEDAVRSGGALRRESPVFEENVALAVRAVEE